MPRLSGKSHSDKPQVIRTPQGRPIGHISLEDGRRVLVRRVHEGTRFRARDGWPLGACALEQAKAGRAELLRYLAPEGCYEVPLSVFLALAERLPFAHEVQFVLPRRRWRFTPAAQQPLQLSLAGVLP